MVWLLGALLLSGDLSVATVEADFIAWGGVPVATLAKVPAIEVDLAGAAGRGAPALVTLGDFEAWRLSRPASDVCRCGLACECDAGECKDKSCRSEVVPAAKPAIVSKPAGRVVERISTTDPWGRYAVRVRAVDDAGRASVWFEYPSASWSGPTIENLRPCRRIVNGCCVSW